MARVKQKLDFEGLVDPPPANPTPFLDNAYGFIWTGLRAYDNTNLPSGQDPVDTHGGTGFAYNGGVGQRSTMFHTTDFALRKLYLIDVGGDDAGESVAIRGFRDGQQVAETFAFLTGSEAPQLVRLGAAFKNVDFVDFIWGNFGSVSAAIDDMVVKVEAPAAAPFAADAAFI